MTPTDTTIDEPLILTGDGYGLSILPAAEAAKAEILKTAALVVVVNDPPGDAAAEAEIRKLARMRIGLENARVAAKRPALDFGTKVDETARKFIATVLAEETRLKKAREGYATAVLSERRRVLRELDEKRQAGERALRLKQAEEKRAAGEKERARLEAETPEEEAAAQAAVETAAAAPSPSPAPVVETPAAPVLIPAAPRGVRMVVDYEVLDLDAVYQANPNLVALAIRRLETLDAIAALTVDGVLPEIPGLRVFETARAR
jgi:hypothetical protein